MSTVEEVADWLETQNMGIVGTSIFCYSWGMGVENGVLVGSTGGLAPDRFIDGDRNRIVYPFINILVRDEDTATALSNAESIIELFEKNTISEYISNKPRRDEPRFIMEEKTSKGSLFYFGLDINIQQVKTNN